MNDLYGAVNDLLRSVEKVREAQARHAEECDDDACWACHPHRDLTPPKPATRIPPERKDIDE